jgi:hypothetical protein
MRTCTVFILVAVAAVLAACGGGGNRNIFMLKDVASVDLNCDPHSLVASDEKYIGTVHGCGREAAYIWQRDKRWLAPFDRATIELSCPRAELSAKILSQNSVAVSGCGKSAIYVADLLNSRDWILNSSTKP